MQISKKFSFSRPNTGNLIFEGDNIDSLALLHKTHEGSIDCIYIDPPYNTGNRHFVYKDAFGGGFVDQSEWVKFMRPRLETAREVLSESGVIFVSIDDHELGHLLVLMDMIFGKQNKIGTFIKTVQGGKNDSKFIKTAHEYLVVYGKTKESIKSLNRKKIEPQNGADQQLNKWGDNDRRTDRPNLYYPIYVSSDGKRISIEKFSGASTVYPIKSNGDDGCWRWGKEKVANESSRLIVKQRTDGRTGIYVKADSGGESSAPWGSIISEYPSGGGSMIRDIFGDAKAFNYAKNLDYMKWIISLLKDKNAIILDFFAGSGTTGHAVINLNKEDGGERKFILCGNTEKTKDDPNKNICKQVCAERVKLAISKDKMGALDSGFDYYLVEGQSKKVNDVSALYKVIAEIKYGLESDEINKGTNSILAKNDLLYLGENRKGDVYLLNRAEGKKKVTPIFKELFKNANHIKFIEESELSVFPINESAEQRAEVA